jgi:hypothetical protein
MPKLRGLAPQITWKLVVGIAAAVVAAVVGGVWFASLFQAAKLAVAREQDMACDHVKPFGMCHTRAGNLLDSALREYCAVAAAVCSSDPLLTALVTALGSAKQQISWALPGWVVRTWGFFGSVPSVGLSLFTAAKRFGFAVPWGLVAPFGTQVLSWVWAWARTRPGPGHAHAYSHSDQGSSTALALCVDRGSGKPVPLCQGAALESGWGTDTTASDADRVLKPARMFKQE